MATADERTITYPDGTVETWDQISKRKFKPGKAGCFHQDLMTQEEIHRSPNLPKGGVTRYRAFCTSPGCDAEGPECGSRPEAMRAFSDLYKSGVSSVTIRTGRAAGDNTFIPTQVRERFRTTPAPKIVQTPKSVGTDSAGNPTAGGAGAVHTRLKRDTGNNPNCHHTLDSPPLVAYSALVHEKRPNGKTFVKCSLCGAESRAWTKPSNAVDEFKELYPLKNS